MGDKAIFSQPRSILFDLDGTLLDSLPGIQYSADVAFHACGLKKNDVDFRSLIGPPIRTILSCLCEQASERELNCLEKSFRESYDSEGWRRTYHYTGAKELLTKLQGNGHRLFVVSNKPQHVSVRILEAEGTLELFDEIMTRDSREPSYSGKEEMVSCLLAKQAIQPEDCLMVGDTMEDAEAAAHAGVRFCLMTHGYGDVPVGSSVSVSLRFDSFDAFISIL